MAEPMSDERRAELKSMAQAFQDGAWELHVKYGEATAAISALYSMIDKLLLELLGEVERLRQIVAAAERENRRLREQVMLDWESLDEEYGPPFRTQAELELDLNELLAESEEE